MLYNELHYNGLMTDRGWFFHHVFSPSPHPPPFSFPPFRKVLKPYAHHSPHLAQPSWH